MKTIETSTASQVAHTARALSPSPRRGMAVKTSVRAGTVNSCPGQDRLTIGCPQQV